MALVSLLGEKRGCATIEVAAPSGLAVIKLPHRPDCGALPGGSMLQLLIGSTKVVVRFGFTRFRFVRTTLMCSLTSHARSTLPVTRAQATTYVLRACAGRASRPVAPVFALFACDERGVEQRCSVRIELVVVFSADPPPTHSAIIGCNRPRSFCSVDPSPLGKRWATLHQSNLAKRPPNFS